MGGAEAVAARRDDLLDLRLLMNLIGLQRDGGIILWNIPYSARGGNLEFRPGPEKPACTPPCIEAVAAIRHLPARSGQFPPCQTTVRLTYAPCRTIVPIVQEQLGQRFYIRRANSNLPRLSRREQHSHTQIGGLLDAVRRRSGCSSGLAFHGRATGGLAPPAAVVIQLTVGHEPCSHPARCRRLRRRHRAGRESLGGVASSQLTTAPGRTSRPVAFFQPCKSIPAPRRSSLEQSRNTKGPRKGFAGLSGLFASVGCTRHWSCVVQVILLGRTRRKRPIQAAATCSHASPAIVGVGKQRPFRDWLAESGADARWVFCQEVARTTSGVVRVGDSPCGWTGLCDFRHSPIAGAAARAEAALVAQGGAASSTCLRRAGTVPPHADTTTEANQHGQGRAHEERSSHYVGSFISDSGGAKVGRRASPIPPCQGRGERPGVISLGRGAAAIASQRTMAL